MELLVGPTMRPGLMPPDASTPAHDVAPATGPMAHLVSVVIPVFNEAAGLTALHARLGPVLDALDRPAEVIYVDDGSTDRSLPELLVLQAHDRRVTVVTLARNAGQHAAVLAGFAQARGAVVVTLDADLQNPPEEIPRLLAAIDAGHDVVGTWREGRGDPVLRRSISAAVTWLASHSVGVPMRDCGSMLRAYRREIVDQVLQTAERAPFIPVLAAWVAERPTDISIGHAPRLAGRSRYSTLRFMRLGFDLITAFSMLPIQLVSLAGVGVATAGMGFGLFLFVRRLVVGPESEGVFTLFAILFVFIGFLILAIGLVGEYVGRIYLEVRGRPPYVVRAVYRPEEARPCASS
jgi:undecaprenyl-phosphate 4-deoxy-4-formamido-L-arabinose transferase